MTISTLDKLFPGSKIFHAPDCEPSVAYVLNTTVHSVCKVIGYLAGTEDGFVQLQNFIETSRRCDLEARKDILQAAKSFVDGDEKFLITFLQKFPDASSVLTAEAQAQVLANARSALQNTPGMTG